MGSQLSYRPIPDDPVSVTRIRRFVKRIVSGTAQLPEGDGTGSGYVQRVYPMGHGDLHGIVAGGDGAVGQAVALGAQHDGQLRLGGKGGIVEDDRFRQNAARARVAGLRVGLYFFSPAVSPEEAAEEAQWLVDAAQDFKIDMPLVFDWENIDPSSVASGDTVRTAEMTGEDVTACAAAFCAGADAVPADFFFLLIRRCLPYMKSMICSSSASRMRRMAIFARTRRVTTERKPSS